MALGDMDLARERVEALRAALPPAADTRILETHISWVLLSGTEAYKFKKPVDFGFLDFTTLERREFYCREELRLNRRLAPDLYLDVVPVTGSQQAPRLGPGPGKLLDWGVHMRRFPQSAQLDRQLAAGKLAAADLAAFAARLAGFHGKAQVATDAGGPGLPSALDRAAMDNFRSVRGQALLGEAYSERVRTLQTWTRAQFDSLAPLLWQRHAQGKVRECHGDLHLSNLLRLEDGSVTAFDCIEFSPDLRWIDVLNDAAFLVMDLLERGRQDLGYAFLNAYLEETGDYEGLRALPYFIAYRSMVRAKVALLQAAQDSGPADRASAVERAMQHVDLAADVSVAGPTRLVITHGLSGSGKSWLSRQLAVLLPAIWLRSDVERKRLHGLHRMADSKSAPGQQLYTSEAGQATYGRLRDLAEGALAAGFNVLVDAAFLEPDRRDMFRALARKASAGFCILDCRAPETTLRDRVQQRHDSGTDPSEADLAVLQHQLQQDWQLREYERAETVAVDTRRVPDLPDLVRQLLGPVQAG